jgi:uncharacterized protein YrrD
MDTKIMLRSIQDLLTCTVSCSDGELGKVEKIYFDVQNWQVRYMMVDISVWTYGKRIAVPPGCIHQIDFGSGDIKLRLRVQQMLDSPAIDLLQPHCSTLLSTTQAVSFTIEADEGPVGRVRDFLFDDESWLIKYLNTDTHEWWQSESEFLLPTASIRSIDSAGATISTSLSREAIQHSPMYPDPVTL